MEIRIYVANLAEYVAGRLVGEWIELPCADLAEVLDRISRNGQDELAIHDFEAPFQIGEYDSIEDLNAIAEQLQDLDEDLFAAIEDATGYESKQIISIMEDGSYMAYHGVDGLEDVAEQMVDEGLFGDIPDSIASYIDYEKIGRDLGFDGWHYHSKTSIAVRVD